VAGSRNTLHFCFWSKEPVWFLPACRAATPWFCKHTFASPVLLHNAPYFVKARGLPQPYIRQVVLVRFHLRNSCCTCVLDSSAAAPVRWIHQLLHLCVALHNNL
jgi:hypothetical protein